MSSDRSIGGFCHSTGEESEHVMSKRRMLEGEGIVFKNEGGVDKIGEGFFVDFDGARAAVARSSSSERKRRRTNDAKEEETASKKRSSTSEDDEPKVEDGITKEKLKEEILSLLQTRQPNKTA